MFHNIDGYVLRPLEANDLGALYEYKNDPQIANMLGGFSTGYSAHDLEDWLDFHRRCTDEVLWAIAERTSNRCVGHVGLYKIDHRIRSAEFAILIGDRSLWGQGLGRTCTTKVVDYGFRDLNLNRIQLTVLASNERATRLYRSFGFREEGRMRQAQFKEGKYVDLLIMALLREDYIIAPAV
jgi:RimJ/RimL family protein N-acetyltransferase